MEVHVAYWRYYVPDCPADLEVTASEFLGVFSTREKATEAMGDYKRVVEALDAQDQEPYEEGETFESRHDGFFEMVTTRVDAQQPTFASRMTEVIEKEKSDG